MEFSLQTLVFFSRKVIQWFLRVSERLAADTIFPFIAGCQPFECIFHVTKTPPWGPTSKRQTEWVFEASPSAFSDPIWCGVGEGDRRRLWEPG